MFYHESHNRILLTPCLRRRREGLDLSTELEALCFYVKSLIFIRSPLVPTLYNLYFSYFNNLLNNIISHQHGPGIRRLYFKFHRLTLHAVIPLKLIGLGLREQMITTCPLLRQSANYKRFLRRMFSGYREQPTSELIPTSLWILAPIAPFFLKFKKYDLA